MAAVPYLLKAAAPLVPGASRLPWVAGGGGPMPDTELVRSDVAIDSSALAQYARVCGFTLRDELPVTYPHVLAFPLHMDLMTDGSFPFRAVGLVHLENRIVQYRRLRSDERLELRVRATDPAPHPKGRTFSLLTDVLVDGELAWAGVSTMLRRGGEDGSRSPKNANDPPVGSVEWRLGGDLGRRYAAVSGDRNPIHMSGPSAKLFGFPRAIAHGMWTKARSLAALERRLPDAFTVDVEFRRPILLPGRVAFGSATEEKAIAFGVRDARKGTPHLVGTVKTTKPRKRRTPQ